MRFFRSIERPLAFTFDLDDTLYDNGPIIRRATQTLSDFLDQQHPDIAQLSKKHWRSLRRNAIASDPRLASDMSRLRQTILTELAVMAGYTAERATDVADQGYRLFYQARSDFSVDKNIYSCLKALSEHRPIVAITNGNVDLDAVGIGSLFSAIFQANIHAPMKPSPAMFNTALEVLDLPANRVLHVGDHLIKDVWAARNVGMRTAWYACNRRMDMNSEPIRLLPDLALSTLDDLLRFID